MIKKCPFCGSESSIVLCTETDDYGNERRIGFVVQCNNNDCKASLKGSMEYPDKYDDNTSFELRQMAIDKWNKRVDDYV